MSRAKGIGPPTGKKPFGSEYLDVRSGKVWLQKGDFNSRNWQIVDEDTSSSFTNSIFLLATASNLFPSGTQTNFDLEPGITAFSYHPTLLVISANTFTTVGDNIVLLQSAQYLTTATPFPAIGEVKRIPVTNPIAAVESSISNWYLGQDGFGGYGANDMAARLYGYLIPY